MSEKNKVFKVVESDESIDAFKAEKDKKGKLRCRDTIFKKVYFSSEMMHQFPIEIDNCLFSYCRFETFDLTGKYVSNTMFEGGTIYNWSKIILAHLDRVVFSGISSNCFSFTCTEMNKVKFHKVNLTSSNWYQTEATSCLISECSLYGANFAGSELRDVTFKKANMSYIGAVRNTIMDDVRFTDCEGVLVTVMGDLKITVLLTDDLNAIVHVNDNNILFDSRIVKSAVDHLKLVLKIEDNEKKKSISDSDK